MSSNLVPLWNRIVEMRYANADNFAFRALANEAVANNAIETIIQCPETITDMFKLSDSNRYELRSNKTKLMLSKPKSNSMKRTFSYAAAKVWNKEIDIKLLNQGQGVKIVTYNII